jgi:hypothetical protein
MAELNEDDELWKEEENTYIAEMEDAQHIKPAALYRGPSLLSLPGKPKEAGGVVPRCHALENAHPTLRDAFDNRS